jgi:hypothetical protein
LYYIDYSLLLNTINEPDNLLNILTQNLNYETMRYIRLDLSNLNVSFKFTFDNYEEYKNVLVFSLSILDNTIDHNIIKINQYDIYISLKFNLSNNIGINKLINTTNFIKSLFNYYSTAKARYYTNKIKYTDLLIKKNEFANFVNTLFGKEYQNIINQQTNNYSTANLNYYLYYNVFFPLHYSKNVFNNDFNNLNSIQMDIFNLKENIIFGNLDTNDFNGSLINNQSMFLNASNINSPYSLCTITYIRLLISLITDNYSNINIQDFLLLVNSPLQNFNILIQKYSKNIVKFNEIILKNLVKNNVLFLNNSSIKSLLYQNVSFNNYNYLLKQFVSKKISNYDNAIINFYLFGNLFKNINSNNYSSFNMNNLLIQTIVIANYLNLNFTDVISINFFYSTILNYTNNNNVFNQILYNYFNNSQEQIKYFDILNHVYKNLENFLYYTIYLTELIVNTNKSLFSIYNKNSNFIYSNNGIIQQVVNQNPYDIVIFPLTSSFFFYTSNSNTDSNTDYNLFYNLNNVDYQNLIKSSINNLYLNDFYRYNINLNNNYNDFSNVYDFFNNLYLNDVINNYYVNTKLYLNSLNYSCINDFVSNINNTNTQTIYNTVDYVDNIILYDLFRIADNKLFNNSFSFYETNYPNTNDYYFISKNVLSPTNYLNFIFLPNSPYYRLYYLFNFLCNMTTDTNLINTMPKDLNQLRDLILLIFVNMFNNYSSEIDINEFFKLIYIPNINYTDETEANEKKLNYNFINSFNIDVFFSFNINLNENFLCYDNINILNNEKIKEIFNDETVNKNLYIYAPFYFILKNVDVVKNILNNFINSNQGIEINNGFDITLLLINLYNNNIFNFDDLVIFAFVITLKINSKYFINVDNIINFILQFLNKNNDNFDICINNLNTIIQSPLQYDNFNNVIYNPQEFITNNYYKNCFYTSYSIGTLFDNINKLIISTINQIYYVPNLLTEINFYSFIEKTNTFDIKQNKNILSYQQIYDGFSYYKNLLFNVNISFGDNIINYYQNITNGVIKYLFDNFTYLNNYLVSDFVFTNLISIIETYQTIYNNKNNTNINVFDYFITLFKIPVVSTVKKFQTNSIILIYLLFYLFIIICLNNDVDKFLNINLSTNFNNFVISKYAQNIYTSILEDFLKIISTSNEKLIFNYAIIYMQNVSEENNFINSLNLPYLHNIIFDLNNTNTLGVVGETGNNDFVFNNTNLFENKLLNFNKFVINKNEIINTVFDNQYNINDTVSWFQTQTNNKNFNVNNSKKQICYNAYFFNDYAKTINTITDENKKLLNIANNKYFLNYITTNNFVSFDLFTTSVDYVNTIYDNTTYLIKQIYDNLYKSYQFYNFSNTYNYNIKLIEQIFSILSKFFNINNSTKTYTYTLFFSNTKNFLINNANLNSTIQNNIYDITTYEPTLINFPHFRNFVIRYFNSRIISSINLEKNINRYLYIYINQYVLNIHNNDEFILNFMNTNSLYDYVKLYNNIYTKSINKQYEANLALYQNDISFEILNYENYTDKNNFLQNPIFIDFIINFSLNPIDENSFYINFKRYLVFLESHNNSNLYNKFILSNNQNVINYFNDVSNLDELHNYIYLFINSMEYFSPLSIYNDILYLKTQSTETTASINSKLLINFDNLMKKIVVYLFMLYLINANMFNIINDNIETKILKNHTLEYDFGEIKTLINLNTIINQEFYNNLKDYIYWITVFDVNYPSIYKNNISQNDFLNIAFYADIKNNINVADYFNLCFKYVSSYETTIGFNDINTNSVITTTEQNDITISKLVQNFNVLLNLDQTNNNTNSYFLTNSILSNLNIFYGFSLININDINNFQLVKSTFMINKKKYYTNTQLNNINVLFILLIKLLNSYNITFENQTNDLNNIIANFWTGTFNINEVVEELKGYCSSSYIKNDILNFSNTKKINNDSNYLNNIEYIFARSKNINNLSSLVYDTQNYSNIIPIDYDFGTLNFNMKTIYKNGIDIYKKYYNEDYNFYNFQENYTVIYKQKYIYYGNIINNNYALLNIKMFSKELFNFILTDIIYTWLSQPYFLYNGDNQIFINNFNELIKLYLKYYFSFKTNVSLTDVQNLKLLNILKTIGNKTLNINEIGYYIKQLYFYELYGLLYKPEQTTGTVRDNFKIFMDIIEFPSNYNLEFTNKIFNLAFYLESAITLINWYLENKLSIKLENNLVNTKNLINTFIQEFASFNNISQYLKNSYLYYQYYTSQLLFNKIINSINYSEFVNRFSKALMQILYTNENISWKNNLINIYNTYFNNVIFYYKEYIENNYIITEYSLTIIQFEQYITSYIYYIINNIENNQNNIENLQEILTEIIQINFNYISFEKLNILYEIIFNEKNNITEKQTFINNFSLKLLNLITNNNYGLVLLNYDEIFYNNKLNFELLLLNYTAMSINNPNLSIDYIYETNYKLEILYKMELFYIYINNLDDSNFYDIFLFNITKCNKYLYDYNLFYCINLENDICNYLDFINKNIIKNNLIENYFKNIQNSTIKSINNFNINNFYNYESNTKFMETIFSDIVNNFNKYNETNILEIFIQNSLINILNQYGNITENYSILKLNTNYVNNIFNSLLTNINKSLVIPKNIFGGTNKSDTGIRITITQLLNIFSYKTFKYDNNIITIFTLIYDNFNNIGYEKINYNLLITYFYYICMIVYILNKWDTLLEQYLFSNHQDIIYELINYINIQIYNFLNLKNKIETNNFFNGLNELLNTVYDNQTFINNIIIFFDSIISIKEIYKKERINIIQNKINILLNNKVNNNLDNLLYKKYVPYNKILIWKNMLVNISDPNISYPILYLKSLNYDTLFDIPALYINKITFITDGLFTNNGVINLIKNMELYISDELIDNISSSMLIIIKDMMTNLNILPALNQMLGINDINDFIKAGPIKPYILKIYNNKSLYIPLKFFFKDRMNTIPLISCMYSDITIKTNNTKKTLFKEIYNINFLYSSNDKIKTGLIMDYILLERTERKRLTVNKQDNLIEKHNYYSISKIINNETETTNDFIYVNFDFNINGVIKELFWTIEFFVNGYLIENRNFYGENLYNMILSTIIYIDGIRRDGILPLTSKNIKPSVNNSKVDTPDPNNAGDNVITTNNNITTYNYNNITRLINPYKYNTRVSMDNIINTYSFAFKPETFQPTGTLNMNMYNTLRIQLILDKNKFIKYFGTFNVASNLSSTMITMNLSTLEYNFVRYQSGLAGLLYFK